jgi:hypothetical protein
MKSIRHFVSLAALVSIPLTTAPRHAAAQLILLDTRSYMEDNCSFEWVFGLHPFFLGSSPLTAGVKWHVTAEFLDGNLRVSGQHETFCDTGDADEGTKANFVINGDLLVISSEDFRNVASLSPPHVNVSSSGNHRDFYQLAEKNPQAANGTDQVFRLQGTHVSAAPEPTTFALCLTGIGVVGLGYRRTRRPRNG